MLMFKWVSGITAAFLGIVAVGAVLGLKDIPRPAWSTELLVLASNINELDQRVTSSALNELKLQYFQILREQKNYLPSEIPDVLLDEQVILDLLIEEMQYKLDALRDSQ